MKKIFFLLIVCLFSATAIMSQAWTLNVSWTDSECDNCSDGYFEVVYSIYDDFNQVPIYTNAIVSNIALTENDVDIPVPLVEDNCDLMNETYRPNYVIHVTVKMYCKDSSLTYELICSGNGGDSDITCYLFSNDIVSIPLIELNPVE